MTRPALPRLASRTATIAPFQVMELVKRARQYEQLGRPIIHMSIGEPDFGAAPAVKQAMVKAITEQAMPYTSAMGLTALREAIRGYYRQQFEVDIALERIIVTAGASAALTLVAAALVNPGDRVMMTDPSYPCNRHFVRAFDGIAQLVAVGPETRFQLSQALLERHWTHQTKGVLLATPSNPTGTSLLASELEKILDAVAQRGGFSIVDEIYLGLSYGQPGQAHHPKSALGMRDDIFVCNSFSKYFGMTGWRLGWLVVPAALSQDVEKLAQNLYICPSTPAQIAALACFEPESMALYEARRQEFQARRDYLVPALRELGFTIPVEPDGAFYIYADCSAFGWSSALLADKLLEHANVCVVPGTDFGVCEPDRYLRISYANSLDNLQQAVARMREYFNARA
jgi:aspartate/methionine/tyrosine aminotransferase